MLARPDPRVPVNFRSACSSWWERLNDWPGGQTAGSATLPRSVPLVLGVAAGTARATRSMVTAVARHAAAPASFGALLVTSLPETRTLVRALSGAVDGLLKRGEDIADRARYRPVAFLQVATTDGPPLGRAGRRPPEPAAVVESFCMSALLMVIVLLVPSRPHVRSSPIPIVSSHVDTEGDRRRPAHRSHRGPRHTAQEIGVGQPSAVSLARRGSASRESTYCPREGGYEVDAMATGSRVEWTTEGNNCGSTEA
jgi:hypothetical protein